MSDNPQQEVPRDRERWIPWKCVQNQASHVHHQGGCRSHCSGLGRGCSESSLPCASPRRMQISLFRSWKRLFRIKPPMCITKEDADLTVQVLE